MSCICLYLSCDWKWIFVCDNDIKFKSTFLSFKNNKNLQTRDIFVVVQHWYMANPIRCIGRQLKLPSCNHLDLEISFWPEWVTTITGAVESTARENNGLEQYRFKREISESQYLADTRTKSKKNDKFIIWLKSCFIDHQLNSVFVRRLWVGRFWRNHSLPLYLP